VIINLKKIPQSGARRLTETAKQELSNLGWVIINDALFKLAYHFENMLNLLFPLLTFNLFGASS
jgi:hypothetical protein